MQFPKEREGKPELCEEIMAEKHLKLETDQPNEPLARETHAQNLTIFVSLYLKKKKKETKEYIKICCDRAVQGQSQTFHHWKLKKNEVNDDGKFLLWNNVYEKMVEQYLQSTE